jgi:flagellar motor protein MotB
LSIMFRRKATLSISKDDENPFLLSFSDLMVAMLAIYILVLIVTLIELERRRDELRVSKQELIESMEEIQHIQNGIVTALSSVVQREQALALILKEIQDGLKERGIEVVIAENSTVVRIPEQQLQFDLGKYHIPSKCTDAANIIGEVLLNSVRRETNRSLLDTIFIEGHTDSVPNNREMGNWGLSTYRAISLWNFWTVSPGKLAELKGLHTLPPDPSQTSKPLISVSGYADTRSTHGLLNGKTLKKDRPEDRRIDIRFTLISSEKNDLEKLRRSLGQLRRKTSVLINKLKATDNAP